MSTYLTALDVEWSKLRRSAVGVVTTALLVLGTIAVSAASLASMGGEGVLAAKADILAGGTGWDGLFGIAGQVAAVGGLLGFGVVAGWLYGREFTDGTVAALFARPVPLRSIAVAKLLLYLAWTLAVAALLTLGILTLGAVLTVSGSTGFEGSASGAALARLYTITLLTALLALPCAFVATVTRGYLAAIGAAVVTVVVAQVAVMLGVGGWVPFSAPGLWAVGTAAAGDVTALQLALVGPVALAAAALTVRAWDRLAL